MFLFLFRTLVNDILVRAVKDMPFWFFHNKDDKVVAVQDTDKLVDALRAMGNMCVKQQEVPCLK